MVTSDLGVVLTGVGTLVAVLAAAFGQISKSRADAASAKDETVWSARRGRRQLADIAGELLDLISGHRCTEGGHLAPPDAIDDRIKDAMSDK